MKDFTEHKIEEVDTNVKPIEKYMGINMIHAPQPSIASPSGGITVDTEARNTIDELIAKLVALGLLEED